MMMIASRRWLDLCRMNLLYAKLHFFSYFKWDQLPCMHICAAESISYYFSNRNLLPFIYFYVWCVGTYHYRITLSASAEMDQQSINHFCCPILFSKYRFSKCLQHKFKIPNGIFIPLCKKSLSCIVHFVVVVVVVYLIGWKTIHFTTCTTISCI